jgi:hypothetical protein
MGTTGRLSRALFFFLAACRIVRALKSLIELMRAAHTDVRTAVNLRRAVDDLDIVDLLPQVSVSTMVFHCIRDRLARSSWVGASLPRSRTPGLWRSKARTMRCLRASLPERNS